MLQCTKCTGRNSLESLAHIFVKIIQDFEEENMEAQPVDNSYEWDDHSSIRCRACGQYGEVGDFIYEEV